MKTTTIQQPRISLVPWKSTEQNINFASALNCNNNFSGFIDNHSYQTQQVGYHIAEQNLEENAFVQAYDQYGNYGQTPLVDYYNCKSKLLVILIFRG